MSPAGRGADQRVAVVAFDRLGLSAGESRALELDLELGSVTLGGQTYSLEPDPTPARLDLTRTLGGWSFRARLAVTLVGPCTRCLTPAALEIALEAREIHQPSDGEDLRSPYVEDGSLAVHSWARDSLILDLPASILCREECAGLCATCGVDLNVAGPDHRHERPRDPRWAALDALRGD